MREKQLIDDPAWAAVVKVSVKMLAKLLMLSPERIRQLAAAGTFDIDSHGEINLQRALHAYIDEYKFRQR